jgi:hypothetical protein
MRIFEFILITSSSSINLALRCTPSWEELSIMKQERENLIKLLKTLSVLIVKKLRVLSN